MTNEYKILQVKRKDFERFKMLKAEYELKDDSDFFNFEFFEELLNIFEREVF